ncbi:MAG: SusD/RagB family nutrient-binding outer membrane lipoprotein [Bacteroidales bacterium]
MKNFKIITILLVFFSSTVACDDKFGDINTDPLALSDIPDEYLFTKAVRQTFDCGNISLFQMRFASQYAHIYVTNNENRAADGYKDFHTQDVYKEMYASLYIISLRYINEVLLMTQPGGKHENPVRYAMAKIVACVNFAHATDFWGDVPYFDGAMGSTGVLYPEYDSQEVIYHEMMNDLNSSIQVLQSADPSMGYVGADPIYNNDFDKWIRFANSLRLRLAMRARFVDPDNSAVVITECMNQPLIESNDQNFELKHEESENPEFYSPWYDLRKSMDWKMSDKFTEWLKTTNDPRLTVLVDTAGFDEYRGYMNGLNDQAFGLTTWSDYSAPKEALYSKSLSQFEMTASEVWFLKAEAALFGLTTGDANLMYQTGIQLNLNLWNVSEDEINTYMANEPEATLNGTTENQFRQISTQMWIAFVPNFTEAWSNIRRTGYPVIPQRTDAAIYELGVTDGILPSRFKYSTTEYLNNLNNLNAAIEIQGPDKIDTHVWWDVRN